MKINKRVVIGLLIIVLILASAYTIEFTYKNIGLKSGAVIEISKNEKEAAYFGGDVLKELPGGSTDGSEQGPTLNSVLMAAGVTDFNEVQIFGLDEDSYLKLDQKQVSDEYRFYYTDHNTLNLARQSDNKNILVESVCKINVAD